MANLHQLNISYDPGEDRLLLKITAKDGERLQEFRLWLTRRFVLLLWQSLERTVTETLAVYPAAPRAHQESLIRFQEEAALQQADFTTPYTPPVQTAAPPAAPPLLAGRARVRRRPDNNLALSLQQENGTGINLVLNAAMLHALRKLLLEGVEMAQWHLDLRLASPSAAAPANGRGSRLVH